MSVYISKKFSTPEEFEAWIAQNEHENKGFLDKLCEADKQKWDNKACKMVAKDGKLQLLCENGNVLAEADYYQPDNDTVGCDGTGGLCVNGIKNANDPNGKKFRVWVGTQAEYDAIRVKDPRTMYYITDDATLDDILKSISDLVSGTTKAGHAAKADYATSAGSATTATNATRATNADKATNADYATSAGSATTATNADKATNADYATSAGSASKANKATNADYATSAGSASKATEATYVVGDTITVSNGEATISKGGLYVVVLKPASGSITLHTVLMQISTSTNCYSGVFGGSDLHRAMYLKDTKTIKSLDTDYVISSVRLIRVS